MNDIAFRRIVHEAASGLDALNAFIETRFDMADALEEVGGEEAASEVRAVWTPLWSALSSPILRRALLAELHDILDPTPADDMIAYEADPEVAHFDF